MPDVYEPALTTLYTHSNLHLKIGKIKLLKRIRSTEPHKMKKPGLKNSARAFL
jgi:hypothetical protein